MSVRPRVSLPFDLLFFVGDERMKYLKLSCQVWPNLLRAKKLFSSASWKLLVNLVKLQLGHCKQTVMIFFVCVLPVHYAFSGFSYPCRGMKKKQVKCLTKVRMYVELIV